MYSDVIFAVTAKGEREKANLPDHLKRTLSLVNGKSTSAELAKRVPPSLRQDWDVLLSELLRDGYIDEARAAAPGRGIDSLELAPEWTPQSHSGPARTYKIQPQLVGLVEEKAAKLKGFFAAAKDKTSAGEKQAAQEMAQARAALEASAAKRNAKAVTRDDGAASARASLEAAIAAAEAKAHAEAQAHAAAQVRADAKLREQKEARARAEREAANAAARARSDAEARQRAENAARLQEELESAAQSAQARAAAQARAQAEARQREADAARSRAELEAAIKAAKRRTEAEAKSAVNNWQQTEVNISASSIARLRELEFENETLKRLLAEAYQEIALLKSRFRV